MKTFPKPLSVEEELYYMKKSREGDLAAREMLILRNMRLVAHVVKKYQCPEYEQEELISIGTIGLIKAIATVDIEKGRLSTYAARCIENAILTQMRLWSGMFPLRAKKNQNGVLVRNPPRICISFAPLRTVM